MRQENNSSFDTGQGIELINLFLGYSSTSRIIQNSSIQCFFCGNKIFVTLKLKKKTTENKKTVGFDMISSKLVKLAAYALSSPLSKAINNSLLQGVFPMMLKLF